MKLDLNSIKKAIASLEASIRMAQDAQFMHTLDEDKRNVILAGLFHHFVITYDLSWKCIGRWIKAHKTPEDQSPNIQKELFRMAARYNLIPDPEPWFYYRDARNVTSHNDDPTTSDFRGREVFSVAIQFLPDVKILLKNLEKMND